MSFASGRGCGRERQLPVRVNGSVRRNYSYYMKPVELKVARIGNSRGVRLPAPALERYRIGATVVMEERSDGSPLRPPGSVNPKLSWEETAREMAAAAEEWGAWDVSLLDGLDEVPWEAAKSRVVAEPGSKYRPRARGRR